MDGEGVQGLGVSARVELERAPGPPPVPLRLGMVLDVVAVNRETGEELWRDTAVVDWVAPDEERPTDGDE